jgi:hypothetical protein
MSDQRKEKRNNSNFNDALCKMRCACSYDHYSDLYAHPKPTHGWVTKEDMFVLLLLATII